MVGLNGWKIAKDGTIESKSIEAADVYFSNMTNIIDLHYDGEDDFLVLEKLCRNLDTISGSTERQLFIPYFPFSYGNNNPLSFRYYVDLINFLNFKKVHVIEASAAFSTVKLDRMSNEDIAVKRAIAKMQDTLRLGGQEWLQPRSRDNIHKNIQSLFKKAKEAGIYVLFVSNFDKYNAQMGYDNIMYDINDSADDCSTVILIDDVCEDLEKYEMIAEQLRVNNPKLENIIACTAHCTNRIYGSNLIKKRKITRLVSTNSVLDFKLDRYLTPEEHDILEVLDAFHSYRNLTRDMRSSSTTY